jgi:hypothetical protein
MTLPHRYFSEDILRQASLLYFECDGNIAEAANAAGVTRDTMRRRLKQIEENFPQFLEENAVAVDRRRAIRGEIGGPPIPEIAMPPEGFVIRENSGQYDSEGNLEKQWIKTGQGNTDGYQTPEGHVVKGESVLLDAGGNVIAKWIKTREGSSGDLVEALRAAFAEYDGASPYIPAPAISNDDILTEYPVPDLHLGALSWGKECGENYDVKIAVDTATTAIQALVDQSRPSTEAVLLFMGDFTHSNDEKGVTPAHEHRLDNDGRWHKNYAAAAHLAVALVDIVARKHKKVTVRVLKGNHDPDAAVCLSVALSLYYSNNPRITIEDDPAISWYRRFGKCLLGATHGHTQKPEVMAMAMAVDCAEDWGQTIYRHIAFGHIHHATMKEIMGIHVESFQAIAARDSFSAVHGFRSGRSVSAITWHKEDGEIGRHRVNISGASPRKEAA